jgi:acyl-coenzyme A thioesterase PaaI-like protein
MAADSTDAERSVVHLGDADDPGTAARRRVAHAARTLIDAIVSSSAEPDVLDGAADALHAQAARLEPDGRASRYDGTGGIRFDGGSNAAVFETHPILGPSNPMAPPLVVEPVDGGAVATVTYDQRFEGVPDCVQGGFLAAAFDVVLGRSASSAGMPAVTGTLTVRYRRPTPLHTELRFEGRLERVEGRQVFCSARVLAGDEVTAEAEAVFVTVDQSRFRPS